MRKMTMKNELHFWSCRSVRFEDKCKELEAEIAALKAKLDNPVVLPSPSEERFQYYQEHLDITTFDECAYEAEVIAEIKAAGFTVKGE